jgi:hypothetical protein
MHRGMVMPNAGLWSTTMLITVAPSIGSQPGRGEHGQRWNEQPYPSCQLRRADEILEPVAGADLGEHGGRAVQIGELGERNPDEQRDFLSV